MYPNHHGGVPRVNREEETLEITNTGRSNFHLNFSRPDRLQVTVIKESWGDDNGKPRNLYITEKEIS